MLPASPRRSHQGGERAVPERVAKVLGWRRKRAEAALWGFQNYAVICARIIETLRAVGAVETYTKFTAPLQAALAGAPAPVLTPRLELEAREADAAEDVAEKRYDLSHARETRLALLKALDKEIYAKCAERDALRRELGE